MISSQHWKEEVLRIAALLRPVASPPRYSERAHDVLLREISVGFFLVRRLIEFHLVSSATTTRQISLHAYPTKGKAVTWMNSHRIDELYRLDSPKQLRKTTLYIAQQFIHAYTGCVARDANRNWSAVLIVSDYDRNDVIWCIPVSGIRELFLIVGNDYPHTMSCRFDEKKGDYIVDTH